MKLSRIVSTYDGKQYNIHLFGYDKRTNKPVTRIQKFTDYFFYDASNIQYLKQVFKGKIVIDQTKQYKSLYGVPMYKVIYEDRNIKYTMLQRQQLLLKSSSVDIKPQTKYLLDNNIE